MKKIANGVKFVWKNNKVWLLVSSVVLIVVFTATMIATQNAFLRGTINTVMGGDRRVLVSGDPSRYQYYDRDADGFRTYSPTSDFGSKDETLAEARRFNESIAEEGFVLLKNANNALPIATPASNETVSARPKLSVFGKNSVNLVYGGSGSGGGNSADVATLYDSLEVAGFDYNPTLKSFYEDRRKSGSGRSANPEMGDIPMGLATGETPQSAYTDEIKNSYGTYGDAALVVLSRIGGEGFDLPRTMRTESGGTIAGANKNDHYLELDNNEKALLSEVTSRFEKVVLIINCSTSMELGFIEDGTYGEIDAALWIGSPGSTGVNALGRILNGSVNPSGRLVDTYVRDFTQDPTWANFSNNMKDEGNRYLTGGTGANAYFVDYEESIYVGYRYWETRAYMEEYNYADYEWYDEHVVYPFGYGLSYQTDFDWEIIERSPDVGATLEKNGEISLTVRVTNNGAMTGKDVVQMYYTAPYYDEIEKAHVVLGDYAKTEPIAPGGHYDVTLTLKVEDMASYDYGDANLNGFRGYELDDGIYRIRLGRNAHDSWKGENADRLTTQYNVPQTIDMETYRVFGYVYDKSSATGYDVTNRFDDVSSHIRDNLMTRYDFESTMPQSPTDEERNVSGEFTSSLTFAADDGNMPYYVPDDKMPVTGWTPGADETAYSLYDLITFDRESGTVTVDYNDDAKWNNLLDQLTVGEMATIIGIGNFHTEQLEKIGKPRTLDPDGPAGYTNFMNDPSVYDTCFYASECVIGATWNKDIAHDMGVMIGMESMWGNAKGDGTTYSGWYAPAVNIHRSPFSGRNWEYYSEDPRLAGLMGANVVLGAKTKGVYTYVKHFALNDQETNRDTNGLITWADEQTMREIYFKPFEIIVKEGKTTAMMSSFNRIGTVWLLRSPD